MVNPFSKLEIEELLVFTYKSGTILGLSSRGDSIQVTDYTVLETKPGMEGRLLASRKPVMPWGVGRLVVGGAVIRIQRSTLQAGATVKINID